MNLDIGGWAYQNEQGRQDEGEDRGESHRHSVAHAGAPAEQQCGGIRLQPTLSSREDLGRGGEKQHCGLCALCLLWLSPVMEWTRCTEMWLLRPSCHHYQVEKKATEVRTASPLQSPLCPHPHSSTGWRQLGYLR